MKPVTALLPITAVLSAALLLSGCCTVPGSSDPGPRDLSNPAIVAALCGDDARFVSELVHKGQDALENAGNRKDLEAWGLDPKDDEAIAEILVTLDERAKIECDAEESEEQEPTTEEEANDTVTVDEGDLNWAYPQDLRDIAEDFGPKFVEVDGEFIPDLSPCSTDDLVKLSSDAICGPLPERTDEAVIAWILLHPDFGAMIGTGLCKQDLVFDTAVGDISLFENNPWCVGFNFTSDAQINNWAVRVMKSEGAERVQYAKQLVLVAKLWMKLTVFNVGSDTADSSYRLVLNVVGSGVAVNPYNPFKIIPEFELAAVPYTGLFILATIVIKGQPNGCNYVGINVGFGDMVNKDGDGGDGRLAFFKCDVPIPEVGCTGTCGGTTVICDYGYNADGQCIPPKTGGTSQTAPIDKPASGDDGLDGTQEVNTGEPDYNVPLVDQGDTNLVEVTG